MSGKYDRVRTLFNFSNSTTFHDLFKFSMTLGLAFTFKYLQKFTCSWVERDKDTNSGVRQDARRLITGTCLNLTFSLL